MDNGTLFWSHSLSLISLLERCGPVLVLSNDVYNQQSADVLVCGLTTNLSQTPYSIIVDARDVERQGALRHKSKIKADTIASLEQSIIIKRIARLKPVVFERVVTEIGDLIQAP
ncbi:MAG: type II toxin-antitoxin system PemK/MazF family toxin [Chloroflexi bacterium]|nr:MAG: hypothetical protein B6I34_10480 [Anaerolineaceae bacterium 4572_32.1]RLD00529.1 MAG: type II toxin-antitoxin system PemK/MazF family toxin [Chloroflexota bacterium]